jgi:hypothetical protein
MMGTVLLRFSIKYIVHNLCFISLFCCYVDGFQKQIFSPSPPATTTWDVISSCKLSFLLFFKLKYPSIFELDWILDGIRLNNHKA